MRLTRIAIGWITLAAVQLTEAGQLVKVAGGGTWKQNAPAINARLNAPFGVHFDSKGNLYIVELKGSRLLSVSGRGLLWITGGIDEQRGFAGDNGPVAEALFNGPHSIAIAPNDDIFIADTWNNRVRKVDAGTQTVTTIAGTGVKGFSGDGGPAVEAQFGGIYCASLDPQGRNLYLADLDNRRIRVVDLESGVVRTVAGNGAKGVPDDGARAVEAPLVDPRAVIADDQGNVYILERAGHALRFVDPRGTIRTIAGTGRKGATGDGGKALEATLNGPKHLCFDLDGNILIADTENNLIRKYLPADGTIQRVAGTGVEGAEGLDGPPLEAQLNKPHGVYVDKRGILYITDSWNHRILKIQPGEPVP